MKHFTFTLIFLSLLSCILENKPMRGVKAMDPKVKKEFMDIMKQMKQT